MSKYTTQVRFICESLSGLSDSVGVNSVDNVISGSWNKIFTTAVPFFDEEYRKPLCCKILKHYYLREICAETAGIWSMWMNTKLEEIMPYYNQMYQSAKLEFDPFSDTDFQETRNTTHEGEKTDTSETNLNDSKTGKRSDSGTTYDLYSDTPQGALTGVDTENYLTDARKTSTNTSGTYSDSDISKTDTQSSGSDSYKDDTAIKVTGKRGTENYSDMLMKYRDTMINIDMLVIGEFEELFFGLW